jgi:glutamate decarboxylase
VIRYRVWRDAYASKIYYLLSAFRFLRYPLPSLAMTQLTNGYSTLPTRAEEVATLLNAVQEQLIPFIRAADDEIAAHRSKAIVSKSSIGEYASPSTISTQLPLALPTQPQGQHGLLKSLEAILAHSVNTFSPGFLDKLYAATNAPGVASELILACLNTNLHVYQVSPALTLIEKATTKALASLFGLNSPRAGGISVQGGSASNLTSIVIARNTMFPETKTEGNAACGRRLVLFTSAHGHYSIEKAALTCGFGSKSVVSVPVDAKTGAMDPEALERCIVDARARDETPFYINATAGTTVLGSFDPFVEIAKVARRYGCWMHVDGSWGGSFAFSEKLRSKLRGVELADSVAINPHKMLGVPLTCSFLLAKDLETFHKANTMEAGYLFHTDDEEEDEDEWVEPMDLADLTLQCGRRGDSLKMFLSWQYYGTKGYGEKIERAYAVAKRFASLITNEPDLVLVSEQTPPCLQVCFYFAPGGRLLFGEEDDQLRPSPRNGSKIVDPKTQIARMNGKVTALIAEALVARGFMVDFAPALDEQPEVGKFLRAVVNLQTIPATVKRLVEDVVNVGKESTKDMRNEQEGKILNGHATILSCRGPTRARHPAERGHGPVVSERRRENSTC